MRKGMSISFMAVTLLLITPLSLLACNWLERTNSETAPKISLIAESGRTTDKALNNILMNSNIKRGAILDRDSGSEIKNKTQNDVRD